MTHRGDMSEKGIQFLIGVEDAILSKIIGRRDHPEAAVLASRSNVADRR